MRVGHDLIDAQVIASALNATIKLRRDIRVFHSTKVITPTQLADSIIQAQNAFALLSSNLPAIQAGTKITEHDITKRYSSLQLLAHFESSLRHWKLTTSYDKKNVAFQTAEILLWLSTWMAESANTNDLRLFEVRKIYAERNKI